MHSRHVIVVAATLALAIAAAALAPARAHAAFPGRNGLIAFIANMNPPLMYDVLVMNPDGSGVKQLTHVTSTETYFCPRLSPDGKTIACDRWTLKGNDVVWEIVAMTTTGAGQHHLCTGGSDPSFSPDGTRVVFACRSQIWLMDADGTHQRRLTALSRGVEGSQPSFSPDGRTIVYESYASHGSGANWRGTSALCAMRADGSHLRRLAFVTVTGSVQHDGILGISFSPDGRRIVYGASPSDRCEIRLMNADGSHNHLLARSWGFDEPCFSPDGTKIVCESDANYELWVTSATGLHWRCLTHLGTVPGEPNWGPHPR